jgi:hypothetical protein
MSAVFRELVVADINRKIDEPSSCTTPGAQRRPADGPRPVVFSGS